MTDKLREQAEAILRDWEAQAGEMDFRNPTRAQIMQEAAVIRAALAAAPQPMGCGYPCGYDCNGACFDVAAAPQPAPADREALVEVIRKQTRKHMLNWTVRDIGEVADALLARGLRLPGGETMAWAVVGEDGEVIPGSIYPTRDEAERVCDYEGERVVPVTIRVVEGGDDAA